MQHFSAGRRPARCGDGQRSALKRRDLGAEMGGRRLVVLTWTAVLSGIGACWVVVRWLRTEPDEYGRPAPKPWWSGCFLAGLFAVTGTFAARDHLRESRLSDVASTLAGRSVDVNCQSWAGAFLDANSEAGYVRWKAGGGAETKTTLKADVCRSLARFLKSPGSPSTDEVVAVHIVTHEAMHMAGLLSESEAECAAVQRDAWTARLLGASTVDAAALAQRYWAEAYPYLPDEYRSGDCAPGGALDEALADGPWK